MTYLTALRRLGACYEAYYWLTEAGHPTLSAAWRSCERGDWMLWLLARGVWHAAGEAPFGTAPHRALVGVLANVLACGVAPYWPESYWEAGNALVALMRRYCDGAAVERDEFRAAADAAYATASAAAATAAAASGDAAAEAAAEADAAYAATAAADAAYAAARASAYAVVYAADAEALYAAAAARAYAYAAAAARADAARCASSRSAADLVRARYPEPPPEVEAMLAKEAAPGG